MSVGGFDYDSKRVHTRDIIQRHSNTVFKAELDYTYMLGNCVILQKIAQDSMCCSVN